PETDGSKVGIGAAVAVNVANVTNQATLGKAVHKVGGLDISATMRDVGEAGKEDKTSNFGAEAASGAGAAEVGIAGSVAINIVDNSSEAKIASGADVTVTNSGDVSLTAENNSESTVKAVPHGDQIAEGSKVGVGASFALNMGVNHAIAEIEDTVKLTGANNVNLDAKGSHSLITEAKAGSKGGISVTPVVALTIADNQAKARIGSGDTLDITGSLTVKADNTGSSKTTAEGQADGEKAAIGAGIAVTVATDQAEAITARNIDADGGVSFIADNAGATETVAIAGAAGGKPEAEAEPKDAGNPEGEKKTVDDTVGEQLTKATDKKTADGTKLTDKTSEESKTALKTENLPKAETGEGSVSVAAAVGVNVGTSSAKAYTPDGVTITAGDTLAIKTTNNAAASAKADGSVVAKPETDGSKVGIGAAVAVNVANVTNQATLGKAVHKVGGLDISATMRDVGEAGKEDKTSNFGAEAASGAGAAEVGIAGSVAINIVDNSSEAKIASGANVTVTNSGDVSLTAENNSESTVKALPSGIASGSKVGIGASVALNIGVNHAIAEIEDGAKLTGAETTGINDVTLTATGSHTLETVAKAGSAGGVSVTPVVAITLADNQSIAKIGSGDPLTLGGDLSVKADNTGSSKTTAEGQADGEKAAVGIAVGVTVAVDEAEATIGRNIAAGGGVSVQADNAGSSETIAIASAAGGKAAKDDGSVQDGDKEVNENVKDQTSIVANKDVVKDKASDKAKASLAAPPKAETSEGSVSVAAAVGINVGTSSAKAYTLDGKDITAGNTLAIKTTNNSAAAAIAEGKAVSKVGTDGNKVGIAAAVAVNVVTATNEARLGAATHNIKGLEISATMRDIGTAEDPDITNNFSAQATSGAGGSKVGIAGSVAVNTVVNTTTAEVASGATVNAGSGDVTLRAEQQSLSEAKALPTKEGVTGGKVGIGASVAVNVVSDNTKASIGANAGISNAGAVQVIASADSDTKTEATGGAAGGVAIDAVVAVTTLDQTTQATVDTGSKLNASSITVRSTNSGDHTATATGDTKSDSVGIGASAAVITSKALSSATIKRDVVSAGDITIAASADRSYEAVAEASSKGANPLGDGEEPSSKSTSSKTLKDTADKQKGTQGGKKVDIAAAVGVSVIDDDVEAGITGGSAASKRNITTGGKLSITADTISDFSSRGSGAALDPSAKAGIGVGVGISVALNDTAASIGDNTTVKAAGDVTVAAESLQNKSDAFVNKLSAEGVAGAGGDKVGVAGALAVAYSDAVTKATVGDNVSITGQNQDGINNTADDKAGNVMVTTDNTSKLSAKAWSVALSKNAGIGASVATIVSENEYTAEVGKAGVINANSLSVQANNHKVSGSVPFEFNTDDPEKLKESLTDSNLQIIFGQNNYYTEAIAGSASGKVAVTGAAAVNYFEDTTKASVGSGTIVSTDGAVDLSSSNDTTAKAFVTSVALSTGNAGVGLVSTDVINSSETSSIFAGDINKSGSVSVTADATQDAGVFGLGGGVANTAGIAGVATVVVSENKVHAQVADNAKVNTTGNVVVSANNDFDALNVAASVAVGGTAGIGAAVGTTNVRADTQAWIGKNVTVNAGQDTSITAAATENLNTIAAGGAGGGTAGVAGSAVVETVIVKTKAFVDAGAALNSDKSVLINASDDTTIGSFGGAVSFGGTAGVGAGAVIEVINKDTEASIKDSSTDKKTVVNAGQDVVVEAQSSENITAAAASAAGGGTAGVAGSGVVYVVTNNTSGYIGDNAQIHAGGNAVASAIDNTTMNLLAGNVAVGGTAGVGGAAGVSVITKTTDAHIGENATVQADGNGAAVQVANGKFINDSNYVPGKNEIAAPETSDPDEDAYKQIDIQDLTKPVVAQTQAINGVGVSAVSSDTVRAGAIGASVGGTAGIQGSVGANVITNTTKAYIDQGAKINTAITGEHADQSVLVAAGSDFHRLSTAGAFAGGGTAGVGGGADIAVRDANTEAYIAKAAQVMAQEDIAVTANASESIFSVTAVGAVGNNAGIAGSVAVNVLTNKTKAYIEDATTADNEAVVKAGNNVRIAAHDDTNLAIIAGGVGLAGVGAGIGGSVDVTVINKNTQAYVGKGAEVEALGDTPGDTQTVYAGTDNKTQAEGQRATKSMQGLAIQATNEENVVDAVVAGGGALFAGIAGTVVTNVITADTAAYINDNAKVTAKDVSVTAVDDLKLFSASGAVGIGAAGLAGSFNVGVLLGDTTAYIGAAEVTAANDVDVNALATKDINVNTVSAGGGLVGVAGSVSVLAIGGSLTDEARSYLSTEDGSGSAQSDADSKAQTNQADSMIGGYAYTYTDEDGNTHNIADQASGTMGDKTKNISVSDAVTNNTIPVSPLPHGTAAVIREGAKINAGGDVAVNAKDNLQLQSAAGSVAGGAGAFGGAVTVSVINHLTDAHIGSTAVVNAKGDTLVSAVAAEDLNTFAIAGSAGGTAVAGAVNLNVLNTSTKAHIDQGAAINQGGTDSEDVIVNAADTTTVVNVAGSAAAGGGGVGAGLGIDVITKDTQAYIASAAGSQAKVSAGDTIAVDAVSKEDITHVAASGAAGGMGVAGAVTVETLNATTKAFVGDNAVLTADGNIRINAQDDNTINLVAGAATAGGVGVGASGAVAVVTKTTDAHVGKDAVLQANANQDSMNVASGSFTAAYTDPTGSVKAPTMKTTDQYLSQADNKDNLNKERTATIEQTTVKGVAVTATAQDAIKNIAVGASGGAVVSAAGSGSVSVVQNTTTAYVAEGAKVNQSNLGEAADQSVHIAAATDYYHLGVGGAASASLGGGAGAGVDTSVVKNNTSAYVGKSAAVDGKNNINVTAQAAEEIMTIAAAGAVGGGAGLAGALTVNTITNDTHAYLAESSVVKADNNIRLAANDDTRITTLSGSAGLGGGAGVGGAVVVNVITKDTTAEIGNGAQVDAKAAGSDKVVVYDNQQNGTSRTNKQIQGLSVEATSTENVFDVAASGAAGLSAGVAGAVAVNVMTVDTTAHIGSANINFDRSDVGAAQAVNVSAVDDIKLFSVGGSAAGGAVGVSGGVDVGIIKTNTAASIGSGANVKAVGPVDINAFAKKDINSYAASVSGGAFGVAGGVSVYTIGSGLSEDAKSSLNSSGEDSSHANVQSYVDDQLSKNAVGTLLAEQDSASINAVATTVKTDTIEVSSALNSTAAPGGVSAYIGDGASINTAGKVSVEAKQNVDFSMFDGGASIGGINAGAGVGIVSMKNDTTAFVGQNASISTNDDIIVEAGLRQDADVKANAAAGGLIGGLGAAVAIVNDDSDTTAYVGDAVTIAQAGTVSVKADYTSIANVEAIGAAAGGFVGAGAAVAEANISGTNKAYTGSIQVGQTADKTVGALSVTATSQAAGTAKAVAGAAGLGAGAGANATAKVAPISEAFIGNNAKIKTSGNVSVNATGQGTADADALGISVGALSVGASIAKAENTPTVTAGIGSGGTLNVGGNLAVTAQQALLNNQDAANAYATAAGGGLIGVNATVSGAISDATVTSYIGDDNTINVTGSAQITADTKTKQQAAATAVTGGLVAIGASSSEAASNSNTTSYVGESSSINATTVNIQATGTDDNFASTTAGSGGVVSGAAAVAKTSATGTTKAALQDGAKVAANTLAVNAAHTTNFNAVADSTSASVVGGSGLKVNHNVDIDVLAEVGQNANIATPGDTVLKAVNTSVKDWRGDKTSGDTADWNLSAAGGGVASGSAVDNDINVIHEANVTVGNGSTITSGSGGTVGSFLADAESNITVRDKARINTGGAIAIADVDSRIIALGNAKVDIGSATITNDTGHIKAGAKNNANIDNRVAADTYGVAGAPAGTAYSNFIGNNQISIGSGAKLISDGDVILAAGQDTTGATGTINANAAVNLWNKTVIPINSKPDPHVNIISNSTLDINGYVGSANDIYLTADKGTMNASYTGVGKDLYREALAAVGSAISELFGGEPVNLDIKGGSRSTSGAATVAINDSGTVETGLKRVKTLSFGGEYESDGDGGYRWVLDPAISGEGVTYTVEYSKAITESMTDRLNELYKLKADYAGDTDAVAAYDSEILFLQEKMVSMGLASWNGSGSDKVFVPGVSAGTGALSPKAAAEKSLDQMESYKKTVNDKVTEQTGITNTAQTYLELVKTRETAQSTLTAKDTAKNAAQATLDSYINSNFIGDQTPTTRDDAVKKRDALAGDPLTAGDALIAKYNKAIEYYDASSTAGSDYKTANDNLTAAKNSITNTNSSWNQDIALSVVQDDYLAKKAILDGFTAQQTDIKTSIDSLTVALPSLSDAAPTGPTADFITVKPITVRLGDIRINADNLTGSGKLQAHGDASIAITNNSPAFLTVGNLTVRDGGSLLFNGASVKDNAGINALNTSKTGAGFGQVITKANSPQPKVVVTSTFNPNAAENKQIMSGTSIAVAMSVAPDITLAEGSTITNLNGLVKVASNYGNIYSNGNISAGTVEIKANNGDFVQSYVNGFNHIGGDPEKINNGTTTPGGITANGNIFISARYLNVNGLIQSGMADWDLTLGNDVSVKVNGSNMTLDQAKSHYQTNGGTGLYTVEGGYSGNIGSDGYVTYDAKNDRFAVSGIEVHGGRVQLHGQIINTAKDGAATGKIRALDGYGTINITNNSGKDIVLENLNTGDGTAGVIDITDTGRDVHTVYTSDRGVVTVTENNVAKDKSNYNYSDSGGRGTLTYNPKDNLFYNWTTGTDYSQTNYYHYQSKDVFGYTYTSETAPAGTPTYSNFGVETPLANGIYLSNGRGFGGDSYYATNTNVVETDVGVYNKIREWTVRHWYTLAITGTYHQDYSITTPKKNITTYSVKASNPIGIEFFGNNSGTVSVSGNSGNVLLQGAINNKEGTTTISTTKDILQSDGTALITTGNLNLNANGTVGTQNQAVRAIIGNTLNASAENGSVNVTQVLGNLNLGTVTADNGALRLTADGSIVNAPISDVRGQRIELTSNNGAIGGTDTPLVIKTGNTTNYLDANYGLKASSLDSINIENQAWSKNTAGNLLIDTVESRTGDVTLKTSGQMIDNNIDEQIDRRTWDQLTSYWDSLQLRAGSDDNKVKQQQAIESYTNGKTADYQTYWQLKSRIVDGHYVFADGEQAALAAQGINTDDFAATKVATYQELDNQKVGSWNGGKYADNFKYTITAEEQASLTKGSSWTDRELAVSLAPGALKQLTDTVPIVKAPNVKGKNVTLQAGGGIGSNLAAIVINATTSPDKLTPEQKVALAAAERGDMVIDETARTISIAQIKPVNVEASGGLLTADSGSFAYLGSEAAVTLNQINAAGDVRLKTAKDIQAGNTGYAIVGENIILESASGGIGTSSMPLNLGHSGTITARASDNIYLYQDANNPDMKVDTIFSLKDISLEAAGNIQSSDDNEEGLNIMSQSLKLKAGKAIGTGDKALGISLDKEGKLTAEAQTGIDLSHTGDSLSIAKADVAEGDMTITTSGDLSADLLKAKGNIDLTATKGNMMLEQINSTAGSITAKAGTDISADTLTAADNISLSADQDIAAEN
ncbi:MAG: hypothetical protein PHQ46_06940, partial [Negativicutes bacterium]|nr:hypothetical protein [Negativicutes bacterium]